MDTAGQIIPYPRRPLWQWIAMYAAIGAIVYGAVYYFFLAKKAGPNYTAAPTPTESRSAGKVEPTPNPTTIEKQKKGEEVSIFLVPSGFIPPDVTIKAGARVIWSNQSGIVGNVSSAPHPAHTDHPALNLGDFGPGNSISLTFDTPGTYKYHNHLNPTQAGVITVQ